MELLIHLPTLCGSLQLSRYFFVVSRCNHFFTSLLYLLSLFFWLLEDILTSNCFCTDQCHKCCYWGCMPYFKRGRNRQEPKGNVDFVQASGHWFRPNLDILLVSSYGLIHIKSAPPLNCPAEWRLLHSPSGSFFLPLFRYWIVNIRQSNYYVNYQLQLL